jgi:hypothetical protein
MTCPKCGAEYRPGFTRCADCEVDLVAERPGEAGRPGDPEDDPFCSFWQGMDARVCTELGSVLDEAGIPYKTIHRQDHLFNFASHVPYQIGVPASLYEAAELAVKEAFGTDERTGCDVMPVLPPPKEDPRTGWLRTVWQGDSAPACAAVCRELREARIHYRLAESRRSFGKRVEEGYAIGVAEEDYERAKEIAGGIVLTDSADDSDEPEDPEIALRADDSGALENVRAIKDEDWYPEDATSLAWDGNPPDFREAIEMAIAENNIRMRSAIEGGRAKLFVLPEHERLAKRIVKEVLEAKPQE